jgi:Tfp pilus assembly protein PilX
MRIQTQTRNDEASRSMTRRSGIALLVVLVALGIVSAIGITLVRLAVMHHRQAERETSAVQTRWLAESALDRTAVQLKADAKFNGSTWSIPAKELDGQHAAQVTITVRPIEKAPQSREVTVIAEYPSNSPQATRTRLVRRMDF